MTPPRRRLTWEQADRIVNWLVGQLGNDYVRRVEAAAAAMSGPMNDDERHLRRVRHGELACALASLRERSRQTPQQNLPRDEERVLVLGTLARECAHHNVLGWHERLVQIMNVDDKTYHSVLFEIECAAVLARAGDHEIRFIPEGSPNKKCELRVGNLVDVECKRIEGRLRGDRHTSDVWRRLEHALWDVAAVGSEYVFVVETVGAPTADDIPWVVAQARQLLKRHGEPAVTSDDERVKCHFGVRPLKVTNNQIEIKGLPPDTLSRFDVGKVEPIGEVENGVFQRGVACTFAFRSFQELDLAQSAKRVLKKARTQLSKDRPSIVMIDAYEPLLELPNSDREAKRRLIYSTLEAELKGHGRPTGVLLAAPEPVQQVERTFVYAGNSEPFAPFPEGFELFSGWQPGRSTTTQSSD